MLLLKDVLTSGHFLECQGVLHFVVLPPHLKALESHGPGATFFPSSSRLQTGAQPLETWPSGWLELALTLEKLLEPQSQENITGHQFRGHYSL